jgi:hypothetical protein
VGALDDSVGHWESPLEVSGLVPHSAKRRLEWGTQKLIQRSQNLENKGYKAKNLENKRVTSKPLITRWLDKECLSHPFVRRNRTKGWGHPGSLLSQQKAKGATKWLRLDTPLQNSL